MGQVKQEMLRMEPWAGLGSFVNALIAQGELEEGTAACGIAKFVADKGIEALTPEQEKVWERYFVDVHAGRTCEMCGCDLSWEELTECIGETPYCGGCQHTKSKSRDD